MAMRDAVIKELESFADMDTGISTESLVRAPHLTRILGHGNPEQAFLALTGIRRRNQSRDVAAAFAHLGVNRDSDPSSVEDRLNEFALWWAGQQGLLPDEAPATRTIRRWSKSGIEILQAQIIQGSGLEPPSLQIDILHQPNSVFIMLPSLYWMAGYEMGPVCWVVVGEHVHGTGQVRPEDCEEMGEGFLQPKQAIEFDVGIPMLVRLTWLGETQPSYQMRHIRMPDDLITMTIHTPGGAGSVIYREQDDIDSLADIAENLNPSINS